LWLYKNIKFNFTLNLSLCFQVKSHKF
jgi:hypothetical protein